mmetsp:Transcript_13643/g.21308  ORF Transcript_13643/g.21308 Transcript_13643/m.21308 type:complete len:85 (+) Transcript_13643:171-425(+)
MKRRMVGMIRHRTGAGRTFTVAVDAGVGVGVVGVGVGGVVYLKKRTCTAIMAQEAPIYGLNRSPIRLNFQQNPPMPTRFDSGIG